jgi:Cd2+/Zn2+-exporting ATPase
VRRGETIEEVDPSGVKPGTIFVVRPGERLALDGVVVTGLTEIDQAPITGESMPVPKRPGDDVFAGTINGNGAIEVRSTAAASDTTLARIAELVGEARKDRSQAERWVERFARVYTPVVFLAALAVLAFPPLVLGAEWIDWIYRALVLLVIGCPCALVISTPVAVVAGLASSARHGVLVKGGRTLEVPATIRAVALDKTGTLTTGRPAVVDVTPLNGHTSEELLAAAAAIELHNEHPIARAIVEHAEARALDIPTAEAVEMVPGKGASGRVGETTYWLGSHRWLEERRQETDAIHRLLVERSGAGRTVVVVGTEEHVCGAIELADSLRADAASSVAALHAVGIARVVMLTGDNEGTAAAVGAAVGIDDVRAELLPVEKLRAVEELERTHGPVAMIGDGVNDAPALARASLGIAMGVLGTDVAVETADVALMTDDLTKVAWLVEHSRRTLSIIRQNTAFALGIKALFVVLTFAGVATLWGAIAADMGASLLVVLNAMRLL